MEAPIESESQATHLAPSGRRLTLRAILPGLVFIAATDLVGVLAGASRWGAFSWVATLVMLALPWITLGVMRLPPQALGYARRKAFARFGWGMVAGGAWRLVSLAFNAWILNPSPVLGGVLTGLGALVWIPWVEETFYRGYIQRGLQPWLGRGGAVILQALLFSLYPAHWAQGFPHLLSIAAFGLLAGWLVARTDSIWPAWGAHALANAIPWIMAL